MRSADRDGRWTTVKMLCMQDIDVWLYTKSCVKVLRDDLMSIVENSKTIAKGPRRPHSNFCDTDPVVIPRRHIGPRLVHDDDVDGVPVVSQHAGKCMSTPAASPTVRRVDIGDEPDTPGRWFASSLQ